MDWLELRVPPVLQILVVGAGMGLVASELPRTALVPAPSSIALLLAALGGAVALAGVHAFRAADTTVDPRYPERSSSLVIAGIYRYTRNPMYLGMLLVLGAWAVFLERPWVFLGLPVFLLYMNRFQIRPEERIMSTRFGEDYQRYVQSVRRWL